VARPVTLSDSWGASTKPGKGGSRSRTTSTGPVSGCRLAPR